MDRERYQTDLTDTECDMLEPHLPVPKPGGRPRLHSIRKILDSVFWVVRGGCAWRLLPRDHPPWKTVYHYFRLWRLDGTWERIHAALRARVRVGTGREPQPSAGIVDSQSVRTTGVGGERGYDGGKKIKGRKRHLPVDAENLVLLAKVHPANAMDRDGIKLLFDGPVRELLPRLERLWLDAGYNGAGKDWIEKAMGWTAEAVSHPWKIRHVIALEGVVIDWDRILPPPGFRVLPRRWVVQRTFSWLGQNRRLSKEYERLPETSGALIYVAMSRLMVRQLARA